MDNSVALLFCEDYAYESFRLNMSRKQPTAENQGGKMSDTPDYEKQYSDNSFWDKTKKYALKAGKDVIEKALQLYYAAKKPNTPAWAKTAIYGALGYFISPIDAIPDITPIVGFADDLGVLALAISTVAMYIDQDVKDRAKEKAKDWFGEESDIGAP
jgi:uncharacterized membrane protein YkvA (DUF1232 family)